MKPQPRTVLRLIDANANRALEGLRVCEDVVRFHLEERALYRRCRNLRHGVARAARSLSIRPEDLAAARDSRADVGRRAQGSAIDTLERLMLINLQRAKESLRVLEECSRVILPGQSAGFQSLRFQTYDVERSILLKLAALRHRGRAGGR